MVNTNDRGPVNNDNGVIEMAIFYYATKEEVPSDLATDAVQVAEDGEHKGKWSVNVVPRKKLEEFRENNTTLAKSKEDADALLKKVFGILGVAKPEDFDPAKVTEELAQLRTTAQKVADGKLQASDDIEKVVTERTAAMRAKFDEQLQQQAVVQGTLKAERDGAVQNFKLTFVDRAVSACAADQDLGLAPTAILDVTERARRVFIVEGDDNKIVPKRGGQTIWGEDGSTPMSMKEWINSELRKEAPHYFKKSTGGGAQGGDNAKQFGGMTEDAFLKLPPERRLEIANQQAFKK